MTTTSKPAWKKPGWPEWHAKTVENPPRGPRLSSQFLTCPLHDNVPCPNKSCRKDGCTRSSTR